MYIGKIVGTVVSTIKISRLSGYKLMLADIRDQNSNDSRIYVAVDLVGAGIGDTVILLLGSQVNSAVPDEKIAADAAIVGIVDSVTGNFNMK